MTKRERCGSGAWRGVTERSGAIKNQDAMSFSVLAMGSAFGMWLLHILPDWLMLRASDANAIAPNRLMAALCWIRKASVET